MPRPANWRVGQRPAHQRGRSTGSRCSAACAGGQAFAFQQAGDQVAHLAQVAQQGVALGAVVQQFGVQARAGQRAAQFVADGQQQARLASSMPLQAGGHALMRAASAPSSSSGTAIGWRSRPGRSASRRRRCPAAAAAGAAPGVGRRRQQPAARASVSQPKMRGRGIRRRRGQAEADAVAVGRAAAPAPAVAPSSALLRRHVAGAGASRTAPPGLRCARIGSRCVQRPARATRSGGLPISAARRST
jgi:hypothetical protein